MAFDMEAARVRAEQAISHPEHRVRQDKLGRDVLAALDYIDKLTSVQPIIAMTVESLVKERGELKARVAGLESGMGVLEEMVRAASSVPDGLDETDEWVKILRRKGAWAVRLEKENAELRAQLAQHQPRVPVQVTVTERFIEISAFGKVFHAELSPAHVYGQPGYMDGRWDHVGKKMAKHLRESYENAWAE